MAAQATVAAIRKGCEMLSEGKAEISALKETVTKGVADAKAIFNEVSGIWGWLQQLFAPTKQAAQADKPATETTTTKEEAVVAKVKSKKVEELSYEEYKAQSVHNIFEQLKIYFGIKRQLQEHCRQLEEVAKTTDDIASSALDRIEIQWQLLEMQKQISDAMIYGTPQELGLGSLYKDFLQTYGDIEEEQEVARTLKRKKERDEAWQREQIKHLKIDLMVAATLVSITLYIIWSLLLSISTKLS